MKAFRTMLKTELMLSFRGMDMVIFAIAFPAMVAIVLGAIFGQKPAFEGASYTFFQQNYGAVASIGICATGVMGLPLVISDYRHKKILKRFKVTPVSPGLLLFTQVAVNFLYAVLSLMIVTLLSSLLFGFSMIGSLSGFIGAYLLVLFSIYSIGMMIAAVAKGIKASNLLCSIVYFPMLFFSGATLPYEVMPPVMQKAADFLPLTQGIKLLKGTSLGLPMNNILLPLMVMVVLGILCVIVSVKCFRWE